MELLYGWLSMGDPQFILTDSYAVYTFYYYLYSIPRGRREGYSICDANSASLLYTASSSHSVKLDNMLKLILVTL